MTKRKRGIRQDSFFPDPVPPEKIEDGRALKERCPLPSAECLRYHP
jgi:hypothetical protein